MDIPQTQRYMAVSYVYILMEGLWYEGSWVLACFSSEEAAESAKQDYESRVRRNSRYFYEIQKWEVLDQAPISEGQGPKTTAVGEGLDPDHVPESGT